MICEYLLEQIVCMHVLAELAKMRLEVFGLKSSEQTFGTLILEAISLDINWLPFLLSVISLSCM